MEIHSEHGNSRINQKEQVSSSSSPEKPVQTCKELVEVAPPVKNVIEPIEERNTEEEKTMLAN